MVATHRLGRIQTAMSPKQIVLLHISKYLRHESVVEAVRREHQKWSAGQTLCQTVEEAIRKHAKSRDERVLRTAIRAGQREALFLAKLFSECNLSFETHLREWQLEVSLLVVVSALWADLARTGRTSPITHEELHELAVKLRTNLRAHLLAAKLIGSEYFDGLDILCGGTTAKLDGLIEQLALLLTPESAHKKGRRSASCGGGSDGRCEELSREIARRLIRLVKVQIYQEFGEPSRAAAILIELVRDPADSE